MATKPILILVTGDPVASAAAVQGNFSSMIRVAAGSCWPGSWHSIDLRRTDEVPSPSHYSALVVTGSAARLPDMTPWMRRGLDCIKHFVSEDVPTLGICFGHQMLGAALGGRVGANPAGREIGSVDVTATGDESLVGGGLVNATHLDSILELPRGAVATAKSDLEPNMEVRFTEGVWGVQFHPEMDGEVIRCYIRERENALRAEGLSPPALLASAADAPAGRQVISAFVRRFVAREGSAEVL